MGCSFELVGLKVPDDDSGNVLLCAFGTKVPFTSCFQKNEFSIRDHTSRIHWDWENVFFEDLSCLVNMDDAILPETSDSEEDVSVVEGRVKIKYLSVLFG